MTLSNKYSLILTKAYPDTFAVLTSAKGSTESLSIRKHILALDDLDVAQNTTFQEVSSEGSEYFVSAGLFTDMLTYLSK